MFRPDILKVQGEIQMTLSNGHVVPGKITFNEMGEIFLSFTDPDMVARWLKMTLDNDLVGLQVVTMHNEPTTHLPPQRSDGLDFIQEREGEMIWFHKCRVLGDITLPATHETCPNCGVIQITRRNTDGS